MTVAVALQYVRRAGGAALLAGAVASSSGCVAATDAVEPGARVPGRAPLVAVFPVENLSGKRAPVEEVRQLLVDHLTRAGVALLEDAVFEQVAAKHRVRYTAGVEPAFAKALAQEAGAAAVLIPSVELYDASRPPRVALFARLVSTGEAPAVRWIDGVGSAGDDAPGILGIGLVDDPAVLLGRAVDALARSLVRHLETGARVEDREPPRKLRPKSIYRSDALDPERTYSVAVVPFFNRTARPYAGEVAALHMMRSLATFERLSVVEPGLVREELLRFRIIMQDGISLADTETILGAVDADLVLNGEVLDYRDALAAGSAPQVDFAVLFIERRTRRIIYSSYSENRGDDGVFFFDWGRINTAHTMASRMARAVVDRMLTAPPSSAAPRRGSR